MGVYRVHTISILRLLHEMKLVPTGTTNDSTQTATPIMDTWATNHIVLRSVLITRTVAARVLRLQNLCMGDTIRTLLQILTAVLLCIRFGATDYKTIPLVDANSSGVVLIGTRFMNYHFRSISCIYQQLGCIKRKIHLPRSTPTRHT